jgi:hypothetical protein
LPTDQQTVGHLLDTLTLIQPQQGLGTAQSWGLPRMEYKVFQSLSLPGVESKTVVSHMN